MGGAVSSGETNEELVDNLCNEGYIFTPEVEKVFRIVDRKDYMIFDEEDSNPLEAYEDHAWRCGNLHLSAPCIYTKAMEALSLSSGLSFLNIGSGTGYLSTMAGLLLGSTGINHGIELYPDNVEFAYERLKQFRETSPWYDPVKFCEPYFVVGNALLLSPAGLLYDRIYCGASCSQSHEQLLKNMLKLNGILVMPCGNSLDAITRIEEEEWKVDTVLSTVSFAPLILPSVSNTEDMTAINITSTVGSLKELCRLAILVSLGRDKYQLIPSLPLPVHLQNYIGFNRKWSLPPDDIATLCPIEDTSESEGQNEGGGGDDVREKKKSSSRRQNGRRIKIRELGLDSRVLMVNINGMLIQLPIDSDSSTQSEDEPDHEYDDVT